MFYLIGSTDTKGMDVVVSESAWSVSSDCLSPLFDNSEKHSFADLGLGNTTEQLCSKYSISIGSEPSYWKISGDFKSTIEVAKSLSVSTCLGEVTLGETICGG